MCHDQGRPVRDQSSEFAERFGSSEGCPHLRGKAPVIARLSSSARGNPREHPHVSAAGSDLAGLPFLLDLRAGGPGSQMALGALQRALRYSLCSPAMHSFLSPPCHLA